MVFLDEVIREAGNVTHDQMMKSEEKYEVVVNPEDTALEIGTMEVKIQDMTATRCVHVRIVLLSFYFPFFVWC